VVDTHPATSDRVDSRRYHTAIPNMIDDMGLDPYSFRVYVHLKRVAGDKGVCWQSTRTIAEVCHMSIGQVVAAKQVLVSQGLIEIRGERNPHGGRDFHHIVIVDVWQENEARYRRTAEVPEQPIEPETPTSPPELARSSPELASSQIGGSSSPPELARSSPELASSYSEVKKNPIRRTHEEEPGEEGGGAHAPPLSAGQQRVLEILGRDKYPNLIQADTVLSLENRYGFETLERSAVWMARGNKPFDINILSGACRTFAEGDLSPPRSKGGKVGNVQSRASPYQESDEEYYAPDGISTVINLDQ
jgi:hypothetical protein